ncbi:hypothetical protein VNO78_19376 [Psophocarpus tetragonolobus]|uniref:RNase H type-1 domain-containing protein n=1 Tax=Psophocarpus tetragonolobus TaxID=3891 RepID=A0AAN9XG99_PSOTE
MQQTGWRAPNQGTVKINYDTAVNMTHMTASIGGVLQDQIGAFLFRFSHLISFCHVDKAELLAILQPLKVAYQKGKIQESKWVLLLRLEAIEQVMCMTWYPQRLLQTSSHWIPQHLGLFKLVTYLE